MPTLFDKSSPQQTIYAGIIVLWLAGIIYRSFPDPQGTDFYPLWVGAQELVHGGDPYGNETAELLRKVWRVKLNGVQAADVVGYPLPVLLFIAPLTIFPLELAVFVWFLLLLASVAIFASEVGGRRLETIVIPLLSYPLVHALTIKTSAVLWLGLVGLLAYAIRKNSITIAGLCIALLPGKPQSGLLFSIVALLWAARHNQVIVLSASAWVLLLWGGSWAIVPDWPWSWWSNVQIYRQQVALVWLLPEGLLLLLFSRYLSAQALTAVAQVIAFPLNDIYSSLPLLVGWLETGGWLARITVVCSWLAVVFFPNPNHPVALWTTVLLPYCLCALVHRFVSLPRNRPANAKQ